MIQLSVAPRSAVVTVTASGRLTVDDVREYVARTYAPSPFLPATNVLIDLRGLDEAPSPAEQREIANVIAEVVVLPVGSRRAIVVNERGLDAAVRIATMLPRTVGRAVFSDCDAALDWLLEQERDVIAQRQRHAAA